MHKSRKGRNPQCNNSNNFFEEYDIYMKWLQNNKLKLKFPTLNVIGIK